MLRLSNRIREAILPRTSIEAAHMARIVNPAPPPAPPETLTTEQQDYWRQITADLPTGWIRAENMPTLTELVRQMSYAKQIADELTAMRNTQLSGGDKAAKTQRSIFKQLLQASRQQARIISSLSTKLCFIVQGRDNSVKAADGPTPWEFTLEDQHDGAAA